MEPRARDLTPDDVAVLREIAEAGRNAPLVGGRILVLWGLLVSGALLATGLMVGGVLVGPAWGPIFVWTAVLAIGWLGTHGFARASSWKEHGVTAASKAEQTVWSVMGAGLMVVFLALVAREVAGLNASPAVSEALWSMMSVAGFLGYGVAFAVSARMSQQKWLFLPAIAAYGAALIATFMIGADFALHIYAAMVFVLTVPAGVVLVAQEKAA